MTTRFKPCSSPMTLKLRNNRAVAAVYDRRSCVCKYIGAHRAPLQNTRAMFSRFLSPAHPVLPRGSCSAAAQYDRGTALAQFVRWHMNGVEAESARTFTE